MNNENDINELLNHITNNCDDIIDNISDSKTNNNYKGKFAADIEKLEKSIQDLKDVDAGIKSPDIFNLNEDGIQQLLDEMVEDDLIKKIEINGETYYTKIDN
tara:strand:+ start:782 stop:1087 length:306 start_codon:yes stop_codon:yes gene_type:complete